jgi:hypothetical protein
MSLQRQLNQLFTRKAVERKPAVHVVDGIEISKVKGLWTATIDGRIHQNSHLGDIKQLIRERRK